MQTGGFPNATTYTFRPLTRISQLNPANARSALREGFCQEQEQAIGRSRPLQRTADPSGGGGRGRQRSTPQARQRRGQWRAFSASASRQTGAQGLRGYKGQIVESVGGHSLSLGNEPLLPRTLEGPPSALPRVELVPCMYLLLTSPIRPTLPNPSVPSCPSSIILCPSRCFFLSFFSLFSTLSPALSNDLNSSERRPCWCFPALDSRGASQSWCD